ncbi:MAG: 23S rRNA (pseudouridine(1915)-N(3))-methyltransferase RlmH [Clostridiales bacterium]|jgi:23S rRNA (pseudouridine1915-N3)-methyltransferase|nr:23S rRNA (pseudouridine(1915)-N(3))-methyltransferase RlmH [Clostridiales bacterium]
MKVSVLAVGKVKESYLKNALAEYIKRLSKFTKLEIIEVADEKCAETLSMGEMAIVKAKEGERLLNKIPKDAYLITLEINGRALTSEEFAGFINLNQVKGHGHLCFIIGGSLGLSEEITRKSDYALSFSKMTFPHQLMRIFLLEQVYRAFKINGNEPYHK